MQIYIFLKFLLSLNSRLKNVKVELKTQHLFGVKYSLYNVWCPNIEGVLMLRAILYKHPLLRANIRKYAICVDIHSRNKARLCCNTFWFPVSFSVQECLETWRFQKVFWKSNIIPRTVELVYAFCWLLYILWKSVN